MEESQFIQLCKNNNIDPSGTLEFNALCRKHTIDPLIALENENVVCAILNNDLKKVEEILINEF